MENQRPAIRTVRAKIASRKLRKPLPWNSFQCTGSDVDYYLCFAGRQRSSRLFRPSVYSKYQQFLYDAIKGLHDGGMGYRKIAK